MGQIKENVREYLKKRLTPKQIKIFRGLYEVVLSQPFSRNLKILGKIYETDKGEESHSFKGFSHLDVYARCLSHLRNRSINLLEIGVLRGESLRMWKRYFPSSNIYGLDIDPDTKQFEENRISITIGSQADEVVLEGLSQRAGGFDIIIDDGSHVNKHMIKSFDCLFKHLKKGGVYIIEDLRCSYSKLDQGNVRNTWPGMKYNAPDDNLDNDRNDMDEFFKKIISDMDHRQGEVVSIQFWYNVCVILKG